MKIYVRRNISSLDCIAQAVARYLKCGDQVVIKYNTINERDILIRFQQRLKNLYGNDFDVETVKYPESGYVSYNSTNISTYDDEVPNYKYVRAKFELVYDPFAMKRIWNWIVTIWNNTVGESTRRYNNRERW